MRVYSCAVTSDWSFCQQALRAHSRTFAIPIALLPEPIERAVTCAYLLCRVADCIEDTEAWAPPEKDRLYRALLDVLAEPQADSSLTHFVVELRAAPLVEDAALAHEDYSLMLQLGRVLACLATVPPALQRECRLWVAELTRGMALYSQRTPGRDGIVCLLGLSDLERYCYFVAGTIGRLLTAIFVEVLGPLEAERERVLHKQAERFGAGLQLVNILRDIGEDLARKHSFIPRTLLSEQGLGPGELLSPRREEAARRALMPLFEAAQAHLDAAFEYCLAIPARHTAVRSFLLIPLWLAVCTLEACRTSGKLLVAGERVKLPRGRVLELVAECTSLAGDDGRLSAAFAALRRPQAAT